MLGHIGEGRDGRVMAALELLKYQAEIAIPTETAAAYMLRADSHMAAFTLVWAGWGYNNFLQLLVVLVPTQIHKLRLNQLGNAFECALVPIVRQLHILNN
jgi:hypothetical protein